MAGSFCSLPFFVLLWNVIEMDCCFIKTIIRIRILKCIINYYIFPLSLATCVIHVKRHAVTERKRFNGGYAVGNYYALKRATIRER